MVQATNTLMNFTSNVSGAVGPINHLARQFNNMISGVEQGNKRLGSSLIGVGANMTIAGASMQGAFRPVTDFFTDTIKVGMNFERQMAVTMGSFADGIERQADLMNAAMDVGTRYALSNVEAAEGLEVLGKAGRDTTQAVAELEPIVKLAEANNMDLAQAARIVAVTMTQFSDQNLTAAQVTETLTAAAFASTASVEQMGTTFNHAGAIAAAMGVPFGEFATVLTAMSANGIDAMKAGTAFRGVMARLISPTKEARQELQRLGIDIYEQGQAGESSVVSMNNLNASLSDFKAQMPDDQATAAAQSALETLGISSVNAEGKVLSLADMLGILKQEVIKSGTENPEKLQLLDDAFSQMGITFLETSGNLKPFPEIMQNIAKATEGMSEAQRNAVLRTLGTQTGMQALAAMTNISAEEWAKYTAEVNDGGDALNKMTDLTQSTVPYALEVLRGNLETLKTEIYNELRPVILNVIQTFLKLVDAFRDASPEAKQFIIGLVAVAAVIGGVIAPAVVFVGLLVLALQSLAVVAAPLLAIFAAVALVFLALRSRMDEVKEAIQPAINAWQLLKATFAGGLSEGEMGWLDKLTNFLGDILIAGIHRAARAFQILVDSIVTIRQVLNGTWESGEGIHPFTNAVGRITQAFIRLLPYIQSAYDWVHNLLSATGDSRFAGFAMTIARYGALFLTLTGLLFGAAGAILAFGLAIAKLVFSGPIKGLQRINQLFNLFGKGFKPVNVEKDKHIKNLNKLTNTQNKTANATQSLTSKLRAVVTGFGRNAFKSITSGLETIAIKALLAADQIKAMADAMAKASKKPMTTTPMQRIGGVQPTMADKVITVTQHFVVTGINLLKDIADMVTTKVITISQAFATTGKVWLNSLWNRTVTITQKFLQTGDNVFDDLKNKTVELKVKVADADLNQRGQDFASKFAGGFTGGLVSRLAPAALVPLFARLFAPLAPVLLGLFSGPAGWIGLLVAGIVALIALFIANPQWLGIIGNALATFFTQTLPYALGAIAAEVLNFGLQFITLILRGLAFAVPYLMEGILAVLAAPLYIAFQALMLAANIIGAVATSLLYVLGQALLVVALDIPRLLIAVGAAIVGGLIDSIAAAMSLAFDVLVALFLVVPGAIYDAFFESGLGESLGNFFKALFRLDIGTAVREGFNILKNLFFSFPQEIISNIGERFGGIGKRFQEFFDDLQDIWKGRFGDIIDAVGDFVENFGERFDNIKDRLTDTVDTIVDTFTDWVDNLQDIFESIKDAMEDPLGAVMDFLSGFWEEVKRGFEEHFDADLVGGLQTAWEGLKTAVVEKASEMKDEALEYITGLKDDALERAETLKTDALEKWEDLKTQALEKFEALKTEALTKFDSLRDDAETKFGELKTKVETKIEELKNNSIIKFALWINDIFTTLTSLISEGPGTVLGLFTLLKDKAITIIEGAAEGLKAAGSALVQGIKDGIQGAIDTINPLGPLKTLAEEAIKLWNKITRTESPSKVFMEAGGYVVEGLAIGLSQNHDSVLTQVAALASNTIKTMRDGFAIASPSQEMVNIAHQLIDGLIVGMEEKQIELAKTIAETVKSVIDAMSKLIEFSAEVNATDILPLDPDKLAQLTSDVMMVLESFSGALEGWSVETLEQLGNKLDPAKKSIDILEAIFGLLVDMSENKDAWLVPMSRIGDLRIALERALTEFKSMYDAFGSDLVDGAVAGVRNATIVTDALSGIVEVMAELAEARGIRGVNLDIFGQLKLAMERAFVEFDLMFQFLGTDLIANATTALENATAVTDALMGIVEVMVELIEAEGIGEIDFNVFGQLKLAIERAFIEFDLMFRFLGAELVGNATLALENATNVTDGLLGIIEVLTALSEAGDITNIDFGVFGQLKLAIERAMIELDLMFRAFGPDMFANAATATEYVPEIMDALSSTVEFLATLAENVQAATVQHSTLAPRIQALAHNAKTIVEQFQSVALAWGLELDPILEDFASAVESAIGALSETLAFLTDLIAASTLMFISVEEVEVVAIKLGAYARVIADAFIEAAKDWDEKVNPSITSFSEAAEASLGVLSKVDDALKGIIAFADNKKQLDFKKLAEAMVAVVVLIVNAVKEAAGDFESDVMKALGEWADNAGKAVSLVEDVAGAMEAMTDLSKITQKHVEVFKHNFQVILDLVVELRVMAEGYLADAIEFKEIAEQIAAAMKAASEAIQEVAGASEEAKTSGGGGNSFGSGNAGGSAFGSLSDTLSTMSSVIDLISKFSDTALLSAIKSVEKFSSLAFKLGEQAAKLAASFEEGFVAAGGSLSGKNWESLSSTLSIFNAVADIAMEFQKIEQASKRISPDRAYQLGKVLGQVATNIERGFVEAYGSDSDVISDAGKATGMAYNRGLQQGLEKNRNVGEAAQKTANLANNIITAAWGIASPSTVAMEYGVNYIQGLIGGIASQYTSMQSAINAFAQFYLKNFESKVHKPAIKASDAMGKAIIDGLIKAIKAGQSSVVDAIIRVVKAAIAAANAELGIASPSKEFMKIGNFMMQGMSDGILQSQKDVQRSVNAVAEAAMTVARNVNLPEMVMSLQTNAIMPNIDPTQITSALHSTLGGIQPGYMNNTGNIVGTMTVGDININSVNDPEYDGHAAGLAMLQAIEEAMNTRKK